MGWKLFLDDEREPVAPWWYNGECKVARTFDEAEALVMEFGIPELISFDHDLGDQVKTGHYFALWLITKEMDGELRFPDNFAYSIHSMNPVGARNIDSLLNNYFEKGR
jgi:hypothetical protein